MGKFIDLTGQRFGRLVVIERVERPSTVKFGTYWKCQCDCGNKINANSSNLKSGSICSCKCLSKENKSKYEDLTGKKFGKLFVIKYVTKDKHGHRMWLCQCDCGSETIVEGHNLKSGRQKSCHCGLGKPQFIGKGKAALNRLMDSYQRSAKKKELDFELSPDQFEILINGSCYYCGIKPLQVAKPKHTRTGNYLYNGIDRVNSSKGYILDNVVSCCKTCNYAKRSMSREKFLSWIERVYKHSIENNTIKESI